MSGTKRVRREEPVDLTATEHDDAPPPRTDGAKITPLALLRQLVHADTNELTTLAERHALLSHLENVSQRLRASIDGARTARSEGEGSPRCTGAGAVRTRKEEKRERMVADRVCFQCRKQPQKISVSDVLYPCVGFKGEGVAGEGILLCEECRENQTVLNVCTHCDTFLCERDSCCDPTYKCDGCEEVVCLPCVEEKDKEYAGGSCECSWFCAECFGDNVEKDICGRCKDDSNVVCGKCDRLRKCEGTCQQPLCDDCVVRLACGNDAHLCGACEYECPDCDMCDGYCGVSRWE